MVGCIITVKGLSQKGKSRVNECGSEWLVSHATNRVAFSTERGTWLFLRSIKKHPNGGRWMLKDDDKDFKITSKDCTQLK
jgi:hypothetical protein